MVSLLDYAAVWRRGRGDLHKNKSHTASIRFISTGMFKGYLVVMIQTSTSVYAHLKHIGTYFLGCCYDPMEADLNNPLLLLTMK